MWDKLKVGLGIFSVLTIPTLAIASCGAKTEAEKTEPIRLDKLTTISNNHKNILVFFNDEVTGDTAYEMLKKRKDIQKNLSEFTIYKNTVSAQYTNFGVPAIVGGWDYTLRNQDKGTLKNSSNWESIRAAYSNSINMLEKAGYSQQWHSMQYADKESDSNAHYEAVKVNLPNHKNFISTSVDEVNGFYDVPNGGNTFQGDSTRAMWGIKENLKAKKTEKPMFKYFANEGTHVNFSKYDKKTNEVVTGITSDEATIYSLDYIGDVEQKIKAMGQNVWDNTMIIYVSDHGSARTKFGLTPNNSPEMDNLGNYTSRYDNKWIMDYRYDLDGVNFTRMNPTLMIKPFKNGTGPSSPLKFDDQTLLSNRDIPTIIRNAIRSYDNNFTYQVADKNGTDYFSFRENPLNQTKDRTINIYPVELDDWQPQYDDKNHTNSGSQIRVKNYFYKKENWEYSDYNNTKWVKMWDKKTP